MISTLAVENYRSLRHLVMPLGRLTLVTGANGTGKSSVYRSMRLLADASRNEMVAALAREGGLPSTLFAGAGKAIRHGQRRREGPVQGSVRAEPVSLKLGFAGDEFGYAVDLGLPVPALKTAFQLDPEIKCESLWAGPVLRQSALLAERSNQLARIRNDDGEWHTVSSALRLYDSVLAELADPYQAPELLIVREQIRSWRFYDHLRTDQDAPARSPQIGTRTAVLSDDGSDLAAALQTIAEVGDVDAMTGAVGNAFPGSRLALLVEGGRFEVGLTQPGLLRALSGAELSDGTLRYLMLVAALLSPRPPQLLVLNEPESSLHPELLAPLAALIARTSEKTQIVVVSHSQPLIAALRELADPLMVELVKQEGQTLIQGQGILDEPSWNWPSR